MDFLSHVVATFVKHVRQHETLSKRAKDPEAKSGDPLSQKTKKRGNNESTGHLLNPRSSYDSLTCLPSALTFLKLV